MSAKPSFIDRMRAFASPSASMSSDNGSPRGSRYGRRSAMFEQERRHLNSVIAGAGSTLRARCRFIAREGGYAAAMKRVWVDYAVGTGWMPLSQHPNPEVRKGLHESFRAWTDQADFDERTDFYGLQALWCEEEFEAGEVFIWMRPDAEVGLQLQTFASELLPYSNMAADGYVLPAGNEVRLGVEFDARGKRVGYHFYINHPGDGTKMLTTAKMLTRISADEIIHLYRQRHPGQIRGYSQLCGVLVPAFKLEDYEDSLLERAAQAAKYVGTISRLAADGEDPRRPKEDDDPREYNLEAGVLYELDEGEDIKWSTPPDPGANYDDMIRRAIGKQCAATGLPYFEVSGDTKNQNFTSARIGRQPLRKAVDRWGNGTLIFQALRRIWDAWSRLGLLSGVVTLPKGASRLAIAYSLVNWLAPSWEFTNPVDDAKAAEILVSNGFTSRSAVIAASGRSPEEVDAEIAADQERQDRLKLRIGPTKGAGRPVTKPDPANGGSTTTSTPQENAA